MKTHTIVKTIYECEICGARYKEDKKNSKEYQECMTILGPEKSSFMVGQAVEFWTDRGGKARRVRGEITELYYSRPGEEIIMFKECHPSTHTLCVAMNTQELTGSWQGPHGIEFMTESELTARINTSKQVLITTGYLAKPSVARIIIPTMIVFAIAVIIYLVAAQS